MGEMNLERKTDWFGDEYYEGSDGSKRVTVTPRTGWFGMKYLDVEEEDIPQQHEFGVVEAIPFLFIGIIVAAACIGAPLIIWKALIDEGIPALICIAVISFLISGLFALRNPQPFKSLFQKTWLIYTLSFGLLAGLLTFVIPVVPEMAVTFSLINLLGLALISLVLGIMPGLLLAFLSSMGVRFGVTRRFVKNRRQHDVQHDPFEIDDF